MFVIEDSIQPHVISGVQDIRAENLEENVHNHSVAYLLVYPTSDSRILVRTSAKRSRILSIVRLLTTERHNASIGCASGECTNIHLFVT